MPQKGLFCHDNLSYGHWRYINKQDNTRLRYHKPEDHNMNSDRYESLPIHQDSKY
jgi:hypothetical protein